MSWLTPMLLDLPFHHHSINFFGFLTKVFMEIPHQIDWYRLFHLFNPSRNHSNTFVLFH